MLERIRCLVLCACAALPALAQAGGPHVQLVVLDQSTLDSLEAFSLVADSATVKGENARLISSSLAVLLGPFGAHRLYLGTTPRVAVVYGVTFGGFGLLALLDLGHLLFTKDLEPYRNNDRVFMWGKAAEPTPP
jgi:TM2 domain-containing membrane protein YozV